MITNLRIRFIPVVLAGLVIVLAASLAACGQVITKPTIIPSTATPTITQTITAMPAVTATPAPYTPEPTATATLSPTPVVHTIASGETLIAIASRYGVSVAAIQEANGIVDARLLRVNQEIVIPIDDESLLAAGTPTPKPTPLPLEFSKVYFGNDERGGLWALGEVTNPGTEPLEGIRVSVTLLDDSNQPVAVRESLIANNLLEPGETSPYGLFFSNNPPENFSSYQAQTISAYPAHVGFYYRDLVVVDSVVDSERYFTYHVRGTVRNAGPEQAVEVTVIVTLYDALEQVVGYRNVQPEHSVILPGGETTFSTEIIPVGGPVANTHIFAEGHRLPALTPNP